MKRVLVILGHPDGESLCGALAEAYAAGAREAGAQVRAMQLGALQFDPVLRRGYREEQTLEPDLVAAQREILWAEHLVWVYPSWWGNLPALLKGFLDRAFLPGFAFRYREGSPFWDRLLAGRSARLIITMDSPRLWNRLVYHGANVHAMKNATLEFCGIKPVRTTVFDRVRFSTPAARAAWLGKARALGRGLA